MTARRATPARGARFPRHHLRQSVLLGAALGAWLGLLTGTLLSLFVAGAAWLTTVLGGLIAGAAVGALAGLGNHWVTGATGARPGGGQDPGLRRVPLPGVGSAYVLGTADGQRVGVVAHASGRRDVVVYDPEDPDRAHRVMTLDAPEARTVAELLGLPVPVDG